MQNQIMVGVVIHVFGDNPSLPAICIRISKPIMDYIKDAKHRLKMSIEKQIQPSEKNRLEKE